MKQGYLLTAKISSVKYGSQETANKMAMMTSILIVANFRFERDDVCRGVCACAESPGATAQDRFIIKLAR